jgi:hypothetical protein
MLRGYCFALAWLIIPRAANLATLSAEIVPVFEAMGEADSWWEKNR